MGPLEGDFAIMAGKSAFIINMLALHGLQAKVLNKQNDCVAPVVYDIGTVGFRSVVSVLDATAL